MADLRVPTSAIASATVTTDGVTITGNGSAGSPIAILNAETDGVTMQGAGTVASKIAIKAVTVSARLTGTGAVGSGLDIAGWPLTGYINPATGNSATFAITVNTVTMMLFALPYPLTFSKMLLQVVVADGANNYDMGLYSLAGTLVANIGATHLPSTGAIAVATLQGSQTIAPAMYWWAITGNSTAMKFEGAANCLSLAFANSATASAGGVLPNSATPPSITPSVNNTSFGML